MEAEEETGDFKRSRWGAPGAMGLSQRVPEDGVDARLAKLESDVEYVRADIHDIKTDIRELRGDARTDFRLLFGALITLALGLAALMARGFGWF